ncbi:uncharacterized protein LOC143038990 [Oratosquilla oratoria]|uniref:uncharacterized protein LOC143038990 n=1 Tax=Oratosquilla oratoria TaxID=337810 RepID=UPI003F76E714
MDADSLIIIVPLTINRRQQNPVFSPKVQGSPIVFVTALINATWSWRTPGPQSESHSLTDSDWTGQTTTWCCDHILAALFRKGIPGIMNKRKQVHLSSTYFVLVNPFLIGFISVGLYLLMMAWQSPDNVSPVYFGKLAHFVTWLGKNYSGGVALICWLTIIVHCCEGLASLYYCCIYGLNPLVSAIWIVQTLVVGLFSLKYLIWPQYVESEKEE